MGTFSKSTVLVTGANSGLGFEAAAQLAEAGYGCVILACRTQEKADAAREALRERVGRDPFTTLVVDVASRASAEAAAVELIERGTAIDALLLNAGLIPGDQLTKTDDGLEVSFATSILGHHILTVRLLEADLIAPGAAVILVGSEGATGDLPAMFEMQLYDFVLGAPVEFGTDLPGAMRRYVRGEVPELYSSTRYYATAKVFSAWWSEAMARRYGDRAAFYTVSPGSNMGTSVARHQVGFKKFMFTKIVPLVGQLLGYNQPVPVGAKRYVDVLHGEGGPFRNGAFFASAPRKATGPMQERVNAHFLDRERQEVAWQLVSELAGTQTTGRTVSAS